jgi:pyruvate/2-oxoglutarate dehydrogenase complex dihydrolipoamide dehydrogenase (E3) component
LAFFHKYIANPYSPSVRKQFQRLLAKQGIKFKLNTKVVSAEKVDGKVLIKTEAAKGGKEETVSQSLSYSAFC